MTTTTNEPGVEARLAIVRGNAASLRQEAQRLADDAKLALYKGEPPDKILKRRSEVQAEIDKVELLIAELESRLPQAIADRLGAEIAAARAEEQKENEVLDALKRKVEGARTELDGCEREFKHQQAKVEAIHSRAFSADFQLRAHREKYPNLEQ